MSVTERDQWEDPAGTNAPGAPGEPLEEFLNAFTEADPTSQLDASDLITAYRGWLIDRSHPASPPANATIYSRLRLAGHPVVRGARNRQWLKGRRYHPHALPDINRFMGLADDPANRPQVVPRGETTAVTYLERDLHRDAAALGRDLLSRLLGKAVTVLDQGLDDPDARIRQSAALTVVRSFIAPAKAREVEEVIDIPNHEGRATVDEVLEVIKRKAQASGNLIEGPPIAPTVNAPQGTVNSPQGSALAP